MNLKKKFVIGAASLALVAGMGVAPAMAVNTNAAGDEVRFPDGGSFTRVFGDSRFDTALAVAEQLYKDSNKSLKVAYLVSSDNAAMVDAATSGMLHDGVVLLVSKDKAQQLLLGATIKDKFPTVRKLVAVGGTAVVSDEAVANVKKMNDKVTSTARLGGKNRYETNVAVAKAAYKNNAGIARVYLTRGDMMVDALTAGSVANGPVLLVNRQGDIDPATVEYFRNIPDLGKDSTVILGGEASLSDEQVGKLSKSKEATDAWTFLKSTAQLKANVQEAAATYYGQSVWQQQGNGNIGKTELPKELAEFKESKLDDYNFFGLGHRSAVDSKSKNPSDIKIDQVVTTDSKVFVGYKTPNELLASNMLVVKNKRETLNTATQNALRAVLALNAGNNSANHVKAENLQAKPNSGPAKDLWEAVQAQYGLSDAAIKTQVSGDSISEEGAWEFDDDGKLKGLNESRLKDIETKLADGGDWGTEKVYTNGTKAMTLSEIIYSTIDKDHPQIKGKKTSKADVFAADTANENSVDWEALYNGLKAEYEKQSAATAAAKQALIDAVRAYYNAAGYKITTNKNGGIPRLAGADRYETSALLAVYALNNKSADNWVHQTKVEPEFGRAYLASGDDAHLIDSVVAGQLTDGPILLAPSTGEMNKYVLEHLAYLKNKVSNLGTYLVGGKVAVSDEVRDAAVKALKNSKAYAGTANWVDTTPAAPAAASPAYGTMDLSDTNEKVFDPSNGAANPSCTAETLTLDPSSTATNPTSVVASVDAQCKIKVKDPGYTGSNAKTIVLKIKNTGATNPLTVTVNTKR